MMIDEESAQLFCETAHTRVKSSGASRSMFAFGRQSITSVMHQHVPVQMFDSITPC